MEHQKLTQFNISKLIKKSNSAYIISIVFFSSSLFFIILHTMLSSNFCASILSAMKFSIDRNHMFLVCNGILVILVKSSSSLSSSSSQDSNSDHMSKAADDSQRVVKEVTDLALLASAEQKVAAASTVQFSIVEEKVCTQLVLQEIVSPHEHDDADIDNDHDHDHVHDDHEGDEDEEDAEELHRRCEDFIRRMKQGIISESRHDRF